MLLNVPPQDYPVISAGIDWLTCTAKNSSLALALERVADNHVREERANGVAVEGQSWLGFDGYKLEGLFFGRREHDVMLCLSGPLSDRLGPEAIVSSDNVSRLDVQVTVWTMGDVIDLARDTWNRFKSKTNDVKGPRSFAMVISHPAGQTLYLNSRASDNFGRIYDKGVESKLAPAGLLWRLECEFKRAVARQQALALVPQQHRPAYIGNLVHTWMVKRGVECPFNPTEKLPEESSFLQVPSRDVLTWFDRSLRKTVAKAIKRHGLSAVLESLGLQKHVQPIGGKAHGNMGSQEHPGPSNADTDTSFADYSERMVF